jgi:hypothetical protein
VIYDMGTALLGHFVEVILAVEGDPEDELLRGVRVRHLYGGCWVVKQREAYEARNRPSTSMREHETSCCLLLDFLGLISKVVIYSRHILVSRGSSLVNAGADTEVLDAS